MLIKYWTNFSKREDETLRPSGTGTQINVNLKEPCSMLRPSFILSGNIPNLNYIRVDEWNRYYFVTEQTKLTNDAYRLDCVYDPLASYKSQIGGYYGYIEYTSSSTNTDITDPRNRPSYVIEETNNTLFSLNQSGKPSFNLPGSYIVGLLTDEGVQYYHCNDATLKSLLNALYSAHFVQQIHNEFYDMKSCLVSCIKVPIEYGTLNTTTVTPTIKGETISADGVINVSLRRIDTRVYSFDPGAKALSYPSDGWGYDASYLDYAPYTTGNLFLPFVGVVNLDVDAFSLNKSIDIKVSYDVCTGDIVYKLMRNGSDCISTYQGNFAAMVPVAGQSYNAIGAASSIISAIGGVVGTAAGIAAGVGSGNAALTASALASGASSLAGSGVGALSSLQMHTQANGSVSSLCAWYMGHEVTYTILTRRPTEIAIDTAFKAVSGMPYFKGDTIGNLSGFVKCSGASVRIPGFKEEKDAVNSYLNKGFYYT